MKKIILASGSPRRKELMERAGFTFEIKVSHKEEDMSGHDPEKTVEMLSSMKAEDIADSVHEDCYIIGADTVVAYDGQILGKPLDAEDALRMLQMLQGHTHQVYTGVTILNIEDGTVHKTVFSECTHVTMNPVGEKYLRQYIQSGEPMDKAGAYGIQGKAAVFIRGIEGDYENVVGLPIAAIWNYFCKAGEI